MLFNKYRERIKAILNKEKIASFLDRQGFYIVLFICISIIGVTAWFTSGKEFYPKDDVDGDIPPLENIVDGDLSSDLEKDSENLEDIDIKIKDVLTDDEEKGQEDVQVTDSLDSGSAKDIDTDISDPEQNSVDAFENSREHNDKELIIEKDGKGKVESEYEGDNEAVNPVVSQQGTSKFIMIHPVEGEVIKEYSMDELVYSKTLKEWTTHSGIDIESFLGAEVKAAMDGIVEKIEEDSLMGIMITLDHGNGIKTRYANLSTANMVEEKQNVKAGQVISGVGRTAGAEVLDPPHLHFELIIDGEYVNPDEYLK